MFGRMCMCAAFAWSVVIVLSTSRLKNVGDIASVRVFLFLDVFCVEEIDFGNGFCKVIGFFLFLFMCVVSMGIRVLSSSGNVLSSYVAAAVFFVVKCLSVICGYFVLCGIMGYMVCKLLVLVRKYIVKVF